MKTAVSIPDRLFEAAERRARHLRVTRSELFARALAHYLDDADDDAVTAALDQVYADNDSSLDPDVAAAQHAAIRG